MGIKKRVMAAIMVGVLTLSSAFTVSAASSPTEAPAEQSEDPNTVDHLEGKTVQRGQAESNRAMHQGCAVYGLLTEKSGDICAVFHAECMRPDRQHH